MESHPNLIDDDEGIAELLRKTKSIVVLGIKPENRAGQPAFYVPNYMQQNGYEIVPLPVYYPEISEILGRPVYRKLSDTPGPIDMVNVFRMPDDIPQHIDEILAAKPRSVWFQLGIRHDEAARRFAEAGIKVVQDRCLLVEHRALRL
jgi:predicted CoA-binding protein